jgi:tripartite-type tricarboxylate transporter receptor subunit TctC
MRSMRQFFSAAVIVVLACGIPASHAQTVSPPAGKTVTIIVGFAPGGGTDIVARLIGSGLSKYIPGNPSFIVKNVPGAEGMTSMNFIVQQVKPDGLTVLLGSASQADPMNFRSPNAKYDPAKFLFAGGIGRGGTFTVINAAAEKRLHDKKLEPVIIGSTAGIPRNGMQMSLWGIEYLGWNAKWVVGYPGTKAIMLALARNEVDMTATSNILEVADQMQNGKVKILTQSGALQDGAMVSRGDYGDAPLLSDLMKGKIKDNPVAEEAFKYWVNVIAVDKFLALPPGTPADVLAIYRAAYEKLMDDKDFLEQGKKISEDFTLLPPAEVERVITNLANTSDAALDYTKQLMRKQGVMID